jgi:hypothetical protein
MARSERLRPGRTAQGLDRVVKADAMSNTAAQERTEELRARVNVRVCTLNDGDQR